MRRRDLVKMAGGTLLNGALLGGGAALLGGRTAFATPTLRRITLVNTHTGDAFNDVYWRAGVYSPDAMAAIEHVLRDHRSGEAHAMDPSLLDHLSDLKTHLGASGPYRVISGYRSPASNAALHANSSGVAPRSLHMEGRAIDIRLDGVDLVRLRDAAIELGRGGVGFYASSDFVHIDTGRVRHW